jgi:hypothetical protein
MTADRSMSIIERMFVTSERLTPDRVARPLIEADRRFTGRGRQDA